MKNSFVLSALVLMGLASAANATRPQVILGPGLNSGRTLYHQSVITRNLSADTTYVLTGQYLVDSLKTMNIAPGTVVRGDTAAVLVIERGGKIFANGAPCDPIVFTSLKPAGQRNRGDWGGVVLLGAAPVNQVNPLIEGGILRGGFGGTNSNDNTGVVKYTRIEFAGYRYQLNNEINGLTFGGVGAGTEVHHVQVSYSFDDSYEWFGGTVNPHHLIAMGGTDDEFDTDNGFAGHLQFLFSMRDPNYWDPTGQSNGYESDNDASGDGNTPLTRCIFSNCTMVGPERTDALVGATPFGNTFQYSALHRRNSRMSVFNTTILGYYWGLDIRDAATRDAVTAGDIQYRNDSFACSLRPGASSSVHNEGDWAGVTAFFDTPAYNNNGSAPRPPSSIGLTDMTDLNNPNPVPAAGSILIGTADFSSPLLAGFTVVSYRGAFDPNVPWSQQWPACWANFNPQGDIVSDTQGDSHAPRAAALEQNYPNPFNPSTAIRFLVPTRGHVTIKVYNMRGEVVRNVVDQEMPAGAYERSFDARGLASGAYMYRLTGPGFDIARKMQLVK